MKEDAKRVVDLNIMGFNFPISTDKDSLYINKIQNFINEHIKEAQKSSVSSVEVAILACITIAAKYFDVLEDQKQELTYINNKFDNIVNFIEDRLV
jgi:gluconate kinase